MGGCLQVSNISETVSESECTLTQDGIKFTGSCRSEDSTDDVTGSVSGKEVRGSLKSNYNGIDLTITYAGQSDDGKTFGGTVDVQPMGIQGTFKADKQ
ncbi:MAG: hypothetical protein WA708_07070 [Acidobacteriaceae bacterium]